MQQGYSSRGERLVTSWRYQQMQAPTRGEPCNPRASTPMQDQTPTCVQNQCGRCISTTSARDDPRDPRASMPNSRASMPKHVQNGHVIAWLAQNRRAQSLRFSILQCAVQKVRTLAFTLCLHKSVLLLVAGGIIAEAC